MEKKPIVSVTYKNETINLPYLKCVLRLSPVWSTGRVMAVLWVLCKRFSFYI